MKIIIAGIGSGNPDLITLSALNEAESSDFILVPRSHDDNNPGFAEKVISKHLPEKKIIHIYFPMIKNSQRRGKIIFEQLIKIKNEIENAQKIFFPVIGDSMLYSTGAYLIEELKKIFSDVEVDFIPGISAHSAACVCAKKFMAMSEEIFSVIPGTADPEKILNVLKISDSSAIYKPTALKNKIVIDFIRNFFKKIIRVDFAGIPEKEKIIYGSEALENINEYLSIILIWKN